MDGEHQKKEYIGRLWKPNQGSQKPNCTKIIESILKRSTLFGGKCSYRGGESEPLIQFLNGFVAIPMLIPEPNREPNIGTPASGFL